MDETFRLMDQPLGTSLTVYVPNEAAALPNVAASPVDLKDRTNIVLCNRLFADVQQELSKVFSHADTMKIYCISILKVCKPDIKKYELKKDYDTSFLSELYPGVDFLKYSIHVPE